MPPTPRSPESPREALEMLRKGFARALRGQGKPETTVDTYTAAVTLFITFLENPPTGKVTAEDESPAELLTRLPVHDAPDIRRAHVAAFIADQYARHKPLTAVNRFGGLQQWFNWMTDEPDIDIEVSPMAGMRRPAVPEEDVPVVPIQYLKAILATCDPKTFLGLRDHAIMSLFCDTGIRLGECAGLMAVEIIDGERVPYVDLDLGEAYIIGKGRRPRSVSFGAKTALQLDRYFRARNKHPLKHLPQLWLSGQARYRNPLTASGIRQMIDRRCELAEVPHIHPHQFRHTWADAMKRDGLDRGDLKKIGGWRSDAMVDRYGASEAASRAKTAHRNHSFVDKL